MTSHHNLPHQQPHLGRDRRSVPRTPPAPRKAEGTKAWWKKWWVKTIAVLAVLSSVGVGAVALFPSQILGGAIRLVSSGPTPDIGDMVAGVMPSLSTMYDKDGNVITNFYDQYRIPVASDQIAPVMKDAIVAIEDRRFYEHEGVDWLGVARAAVTNTLEGETTQGASTLTQQYVKNYTWLIEADSEEEQAQAISQTVNRKLNEITTAETLTQKTDKDTILTNYLNLVTFGNGTYGIEAAARTYFGVHAQDLNSVQAALLAGLVQAPSAYDPFISPDKALERRNLVLDALERYGSLSANEAVLAKDTPLSILEAPARVPHGCADSGDNGFYCDKALADLRDQGITLEMLNAGGYSVTTSLDPAAQASTIASLRANVDPMAEGVAETFVLVEPGHDTRYIRSLATSRHYGFNEEIHQTTLPLANSLVGAGAGSVFKIFTAAVALNEGMGLHSSLPVPPTYSATGLGFGGLEGCEPGKYCVANAGQYPATMTFTEILAQSPNTTFIALAERLGNSNIVDMAIALGMRSYEVAPEGGTSIADQMRGSGSFTLGPTSTSTVELANVGATIASQGRWCNPTTLSAITGPDGVVALNNPPCEDVLDPRVATNLAHGLSQDTISGTAATAARNVGWVGPMAGKTGTTDDNGSASFLGFTSGLSGASYAFNDSGSSPLCTAPLRQCDNGNLFGGNEPATTWFNAVMPVIDSYGGASLPIATEDSRSVDVTSTVLGRTIAEARNIIGSSQFTVGNVEVVESEYDNGTVISAEMGGLALPGDPINLRISKKVKDDDVDTPTTQSRTQENSPSSPSTTTRSPAPSSNSGRIGG